MVKINKEHSDAFGFKLLSNFVSFLAEHPIEAAKIQKICDDDFKSTCMKCYPIIISTGVDPLTYKPKLTPTLALKEQLREMFPVKEIVASESTSSDDECEIVSISESLPPAPPNSPIVLKPNPLVKITAKPMPPVKVVTWVAKPIAVKPSEVVQPIVTKPVEPTCKKCEELIMKLQTNKALYEDDHSKWARLNDSTNAENAKLRAEVLTANNRSQILRNQLDSMERKYRIEVEDLKNRLERITKDPNYLDYIEFVKFESYKKRKQ